MNCFCLLLTTQIELSQRKREEEWESEKFKVLSESLGISMEFPRRSFAFLCAPWLHRVLFLEFLSTRIESKLLHDFNFEILQGERFVRHQGESWNWAEEMWSRDKMSLPSAGRQYREYREKSEKKTFEFWLNFPSSYLRVSTNDDELFSCDSRKINFSFREKMNFPSTDDALSSSSQRWNKKSSACQSIYMYVRIGIWGGRAEFHLEGEHKKVFIIQRQHQRSDDERAKQEQLWAIKKDWIWLKSHLFLLLFLSLLRVNFQSFESLKRKVCSSSFDVMFGSWHDDGIPSIRSNLRFTREKRVFLSLDELIQSQTNNSHVCV